MKSCDINIRDPFVLYEDGTYFMYGTRAAHFGLQSGGFDVYTSHDLENWSKGECCFDSVQHSMNLGANWAPEVHKYSGTYYMLATFTRENGLRGTHILRSASPLGPFEPHGNVCLTPEDWECLDGTLYVAPDGTPYLVFCHEHTQIVDGTVCYVRMSNDLTYTLGEVHTLFAASSPEWADRLPNGEHYVTDGPFMYRTRIGELLMLWSTFIGGKYAVCTLRFAHGVLGDDFEHLPPLSVEDGGHAMIFSDDAHTYMTYHMQNTNGNEFPVFFELCDLGDSISVIRKL